MTDNRDDNYHIQLSESIHSGKEMVKEHFHEKTFQILYALEDEGEIKINNETYAFNRDDVAFIKPFSKHSISVHSKLALVVLEFGPEISESAIFRQLLDDYFEKSSLIKVNPFDAVEIRQLLRKMLYQQSLNDQIEKNGLPVYLLQILYLLARSRKKSVITDANMMRAERLKQYIDENYFNVMNATDLSGKLGVSSRYVNTIFKEKFNITPLQYLTEVRLEAAKRLLLETDKDIISICFEVGFESLSTFYRSFNHYFHTSPNKFRSKAYHL